MLWLHQGKFVSKNTRFNSSSSCYKYYENSEVICMHESLLKDKLILEKKFINFWVPIFLHPKTVTDVKNSLY